MLRQYFKKVKAERRVTGKALSQITGISENHISEYLNGKRDVTSEKLWEMMEGMEQLSPGAKDDFAELIGKARTMRVEINLEKTVQEMDVRDFLHLWQVASQRMTEIYQDNQKKTENKGKFPLAV
ncbi:helix-turn-helix transcriptional regulator [Crocosphaera sp. UHCC 0190]|uniref:helix-turn-helix transcriptional regulator n=1 Tax=Crocosphaera sp. UHCC 0190 TaxID=3110246 RepID=UPI002B1F503C|nr:helix-turn-helix transcriptional regulator [Crocosphaera sp. UHCC 0190]MEA5511808.1 helix-turn-helix transcriptional regulator [Crocosphaera sp. UHCC 0190]